MDGLFGLGVSRIAWLGFSADAAEESRPFVSETSYRSFMRVGGALRAGDTSDAFVTSIIEAFVEREPKGGPFRRPRCRSVQHPRLSFVLNRHRKSEGDLPHRILA